MNNDLGGTGHPHKMAQLAREKVCTVADLAKQSARLRADGKKLVLCHGVFDLLHLGHVKHLQQARRHGDVLAVTITGDRFVNKGPGRPIFTELQRAEMLAALDCVDWVAVNHGPDAIELLNVVKPACYAKGPDYADAASDVTGKIAVEQHAVEAGGGRIVITDDITFSSSSLINKHLDLYEPALRDLLAVMRNDDAKDRIHQLIERASKLRVLVVGDAIIDEYHYVSQLGKAPKEHIVTTQFESSEMFAGGAIAAANHVASICDQVDVLTVLGTENGYEDFIRAHLQSNVRLMPHWRSDGPTIKKSRFVTSSTLRKLYEVYYYRDAPLAANMQQSLDKSIADIAGNYDLVLVTDFGHGMIAPSTIDVLTKTARFLAVNAQSNSANTGYNLITKYPRADYICIDEPEARLAAGHKHAEIGDIISHYLPGRIRCGRFIVTHGRNGCYIWQEGDALRHLPALTQSVVDTVGAGDAFLSITSPLAAVGGQLSDIGFVGNIAGALKVGIVGNRRWIEKPALIKAVTAVLN